MANLVKPEPEPTPPSPKRKYPVKRLKKVKPRIPCDADDGCDRAKFEVIVTVKNLSKRLYLCGHHFRKHRAHILEQAYEVREL